MSKAERDELCGYASLPVSGIILQCIMTAQGLNLGSKSFPWSLVIVVFFFSSYFHFLSTTEFTILSRTIGLQGWVSDVCRMSDVVCWMSPLFFFHDGITFERFELQS